MCRHFVCYGTDEQVGLIYVDQSLIAEQFVQRDETKKRKAEEENSCLRLISGTTRIPVVHG